MAVWPGGHGSSAIQGGMETTYHRHMSPDMPGNLADLLENADAAAPDQRIKWRDPIAVHGTDAVAAMSEWLKDGKNTGFAIRTLERIAEADDPMVAAYAVRAMRRLRPKVSESDKGLIKAALKRLGEPDKAKTPKPDPRLYERLIGAARTSRLLSYGDVGAPAELDMSLSYHRRLIGQMLGEISIREAKDGRPMLSSVVVHKGTTTVDPGFYQLGQDIHQVQPGETDEAFGKRQQDETFAFWSTHPEAGPLE
jgi:hypothetical protein